MRDIPSLERASKLHPKLIQEVVDTITEIEQGFPPTIKVRIVQGLRTIAEQDDLFALGRTKVNPVGKSAKKPMGNIVTKARGGKSYHNFAVAFDFALMYDKDANGSFEELSWDIAKDGDKDGLKDWDEVIAAFEAKGWESGGKWRTFKDYPHLQKTFSFTIKQMKEKYDKGDFISGTEYLNL